jgi:hypothetical protein
VAQKKWRKGLAMGEVIKFPGAYNVVPAEDKIQLRGYVETGLDKFIKWSGNDIVAAVNTHNALVNKVTMVVPEINHNDAEDPRDNFISAMLHQQASKDSENNIMYPYDEQIVNARTRFIKSLGNSGLGDARRMALIWTAAGLVSEVVGLEVVDEKSLFACVTQKDALFWKQEVAQTFIGDEDFNKAPQSIVDDDFVESYATMVLPVRLVSGIQYYLINAIDSRDNPGSGSAAMAIYDGLRGRTLSDPTGKSIRDLLNLALLTPFSSYNAKAVINRRRIIRPQK